MDKNFNEDAASAIKITLPIKLSLINSNMSVASYDDNYMKVLFT